MIYVKGSSACVLFREFCSFRSLIHFEFIFICGIQKYFNLIVLYVTVLYAKLEFSWHHCWRDCLFSMVHSRFLCCRLIGWRCVGLFLGFLFCSIHLCVFFVSMHATFFFDLSPNAKEIKAIINKWALTKLKSFCTAMETMEKTKR